MTNQNSRDRGHDRNRRTSAAAGGTPISDPTSTLASTTAATTVDSTPAPACDTSSAATSVDCGGG